MRIHPIKSILFVCLAFVFVFGAAAGASAWSEGDPPEGFGTHDWIIQAADILAGDPGWFDLQVAFQWSDYPDTVLQDNINHIYYPGLATAAPDFVQAHYDAAVAALQSNDTAGASKEAALMAHYYDDLWNPWHTDYSNLLAQALYHTRYEDDVLGNEPTSTVGDGLSLVTSAAGHAIAAATTSRPDYPLLESAYMWYQGYAAAGVDTTTKKLLNQAANGLADLLFSIEQAAAPENTPPVAVMTADPTSGSAPLLVSFVGTDSHDADGTITSCAWDFGDGSTATGATVAHTYAAAGIYTASLLVTDDDGATGSASTTITVTAVQPSMTATITSVTYAKSSSTLRGTVLVTSNGKPVIGASVTVVWALSGLPEVEQTAVTNKKGVASFSTAAPARHGSGTLTVKSVSKAGYVYDPATAVTKDFTW